MIVKVTIELKVDESFNLTYEESRIWFENEILVGNGTLFLHSNEIGDTVGEIKKVTNVVYNKTTPS